MPENEKKAVALKYDPSADGAPVVTAKGSGMLAEEIERLAGKYGIAVVNDAPLAAILMEAELLQEIPQEMYELTAVVFRKLLELDGKYVP
jgi:flagellar biosynthesis protein